MAPGRLALGIVVVFVGVWAMSRFGFLPVAPVLAALLVLICGERRWAWIALGVGTALAARGPGDERDTPGQVSHTGTLQQRRPSENWYCSKQER